MSRSRNSILLLRLIQLGLLGASIVTISVYAQWLITVDPFARYRSRAQTDPSKEVGLELRDVKFAMYSGKKLVGSCDADQLLIMRDRNVVEFVNIKKGKLSSDQGEFAFETPEGTYNRRSETFTALQKSKVTTADMDLAVQGFTYTRRVHRLNSVGKVEGKFFGGTLAASNFVYYPKDKNFSAGPLEWKGDGYKVLKELPGVKQGSKWEIKAAASKTVPGGYLHKKARATDGEIIVMADEIQQDTKTDVITAKGNVKYFSPKANMICENVVVYRKEKRAVLTGNVTMLVKPSNQEKLEEVEIPPFRPIVPAEIAQARPPAPTPQDKEANKETRQAGSGRKYPTQVWAERIEYWYASGGKKAEISGNPQARQELPGGRWRHVWTQRASYDGQAETLKLVSSAGKKDTRIKNSIGDDLVAEWFLVSTKEGQEDEWEGAGVEGTIFSDDEDINNRDPKVTGSGSKPRIRGDIGGSPRA